ncbi:uncharacterized protein LOC142340686 [Convolutriloba macropyga]|uniref:uncharacterized protein LOC142340686 n=1 Tax=Convolutriloba macropyga TaxID=536237 RepID=UPI003F526289
MCTTEVVTYHYYEKRCFGPYEHLESYPGWYNAVCALHVLAMLWCITSTILFGVALCCRVCRESNLCYMIGLIVCVSFQTLLGLTAAIVLAAMLQEIFTVDILLMFRILFALLITASLLSIASLALAIVAINFRPKKSQKKTPGAGEAKGDERSNLKTEGSYVQPRYYSGYPTESSYYYYN